MEPAIHRPLSPEDELSVLSPPRYRARPREYDFKWLGQSTTNFIERNTCVRVPLVLDPAVILSGHQCDKDRRPFVLCIAKDLRPACSRTFQILARPFVDYLTLLTCRVYPYPLPVPSTPQQEKWDSHLGSVGLGHLWDIPQARRLDPDTAKPVSYAPRRTHVPLAEKERWLLTLSPSGWHRAVQKRLSLILGLQQSHRVVCDGLSRRARGHCLASGTRSPKAAAACWVGWPAAASWSFGQHRARRPFRSPT